MKGIPVKYRLSTSGQRLDEFVRATISRSELRVEPVPLGQDGAWQAVDGRLRHRTGRFFEVGAIRYRDQIGNVTEQPMILQPEIGTLGFLIHRHNGATEVLVNAKVEPGNVGECQLAPSCQATLSNQQRAHGGDPTPCYPPFASPMPEMLLADTLQSEQGTRFWRKRNRNVIVELDDQQRASLPIPWTHVWTGLDALLGALAGDFSINTDARSVLVCSDWERLLGRQPFERNASDSALAALCQESFRALSDSAAETEDALQRLAVVRALPIAPVEAIALEDLTCWERFEYGYRSADQAGFDITHYDVHVQGREVPSWQQPFVESRSSGSIILCCAIVGGVPRFLFRVCPEVGLKSGAELTPGICIEPGSSQDCVAASDSTMARLFEAVQDGKVLLDSRQSEEGGRFFHDVNHYRIVDLGTAAPTLSDEFVWLSLRSVQNLVVHNEIFTNESRSVLSFLLAHA